MNTDPEDEEAFYGQGFGRAGTVSVWIGLTPFSSDSDLDILQDCCGVGFYDVDQQEAVGGDDLVEISDLLSQLSYSDSFVSAVLETLQEHGTRTAYWVVAQYEFDYDPKRAISELMADPVFLGAFSYSKAD